MELDKDTISFAINAKLHEMKPDETYGLCIKDIDDNDLSFTISFKSIT